MSWPVPRRKPVRISQNRKRTAAHLRDLCGP